MLLQTEPPLIMDFPMNFPLKPLRNFSFPTFFPALRVLIEGGQACNAVGLPTELVQALVGLLLHRRNGLVLFVPLRWNGVERLFETRIFIAV